MKSWAQVIKETTNNGDRTCFGCGTDNPGGLKLNFTLENGVATAEAVMGETWQGWSGIVHGGIVAALLDEAMGHATSAVGEHCVTAKMEVWFRCPTPVGKVLVLTGMVTGRTRRALEARGRVALKDGTVLAESTALMVVLDGEKTSGEAGLKDNSR